MNRLPFTCIYTVLFTCVLVIASGCDNTFEPFQENDRYVFSMFGTVDLHADTQWVRVMPVAQTLLTQETEPTGVEVMLTRNSTGETVQMYDSLYQFATDAFAWNYWVPFSGIAENESYTITAKTPEGLQSSATAETPSILPVPETEFDPQIETGTYKGTFKDSLVTFETRYVVQYVIGASCLQASEFIFSHMNRIENRFNGKYDFSVGFRNRILDRTGVSNYRVVSRTLVVVTSSRDWPGIVDLTEEEVSLPETVNNVENGTGFIPGIAKREVELTPPQPLCPNGPDGPGWPQISTG